AAAAAPPAPRAAPAQYANDQRFGHQGHAGHGHGGYGYDHKRKKKGFLGEIFDFG
ncbi:hypothetical protein PMI40_00060, partial [Herbaspirillum sp. YR522]